MIIYNTPQKNNKILRLLAPIPSNETTPDINLIVSILAQQNERINVLFEELSELREKISLSK